MGGLRPSLDDPEELDTLVATATVDGYASDPAYYLNAEFDPVQTGFVRKSTLLTDEWYDPTARSEDDLVSWFYDGASGEFDVPESLGIVVEQEVLQFSFPPADGIVFVNFKIYTNAFGVVFDPYVGFYAELATAAKWRYEEEDDWPPSSLGQLFDNKDIGYVDSLRLVTEHHWTEDGGDAPSWCGYKLLGIRGPAPEDTIAAKTVSFNWWDWDAGYNNPETPRDDQDRYVRLSNGQVSGTQGSEAPRVDPVEVLSVGPLGRLLDEWPDGRPRYVLEAGDTVTVSFALLGGEPNPAESRSAEEDILLRARYAQDAFDVDYRVSVPPPSPDLLVVPDHARITLRWTDHPERFLDPRSGTPDFEGYRIYVSETKSQADFRQVREYDLVDSLFYDTGLAALEGDSLTVVGGEGDTTVYVYRYDIPHVKDGFKYWVAVTSFDRGSPEVESLESGFSQNRTMVIPGTPSVQQTGAADAVRVFPNPYRGDAVWDGLNARDRYLWFVNLPRRCTIRITTLAGDLVDTIEFDAATYNAREIRGIFDPTDSRNPERDLPVLSGGMAAWDMITRNDQAIASGLYLFSVEDHETGDHHVGKFLVLK
ncbi:MAG: hypothetical protein GF355_02110 [Candidatus Eisenbacteria bacterium]|nr:hypothetical protein [Candidatus Eisenbacteria bacterium]